LSGHGNKNIASQAQLTTDGGETAEFPRLPSTVLKALFDEVTGTKEYHFSRLNKSYRIERNDISQLCLKLGQWIEHLQPTSAGFRFVIVEKRDNSGAVSRENISSYDKFVNHDFSSTSPISCLEIYFNFVIPTERSADVAAYSINIDLHGFVLNQDGSNAMVGHEPGQPWSSSCAEVRIEYVDYLISRNLELVIKDWFEALPEHPVPERPKWAPNWGRWKDFGSNLLTVNSFEQLRIGILCAAIVATITGNGYWWTLNPSYHLYFQNVLILALLYYFLNWVSHKLYVHVANNAWPRGYFPMLNLNVAGSRQIDRHLKIVNKGRGFAKEIAYASMAGVISTIGVSVLVWLVRIISP
tara:strand:- start:160 stop:1224 length:1065 start_codon:yes stop_codon:yes gene_type:complete